MHPDSLKHPSVQGKICLIALAWTPTDFQCSVCVAKKSLVLPLILLYAILTMQSPIDW